MKTLINYVNMTSTPNFQIPFWEILKFEYGQRDNGEMFLNLISITNIELKDQESEIYQFSFNNIRWTMKSYKSKSS